MARVVLAMSGGVDSSVAAHLLLEQGHEVIGVFMRHGEESAAACETNANSIRSSLPILAHRSDHKQGCCSASDAEDARRVAERLSVPFFALNLQADFRRIIDYFVAEYTHGRTPNPCVMCNQWIKFGRLFDYADSVGAEFVATGHYARLAVPPGETEPALGRAVDSDKDQSYVLFGIRRDLLSRMLLPVGDYHKPWIRETAQRLGLRVADKRDSQEICFVTSGHHGEFVRARRPGQSTAGDFVTTAGKIVGQHEGIENYTIGQRRGLGVALGDRAFVVRIEPETRRVVLGTRDELQQTVLVARDWNWLIEEPQTAFRCSAQIRYNSRDAACLAEPLPDGRWRVTFADPRHGVAPGQAVVCYQSDRVLGGGWIETTG